MNQEQPMQTTQKSNGVSLPVLVIALFLTVLVSIGATLLVVNLLNTQGQSTNTSSNNSNTDSNSDQIIDNDGVVADETANWKTYTNNSYTLKYPSDWSVETLVPNQSIYASQNGFEEPYPKFTSPSGENKFMIAPQSYLSYGFAGNQEFENTNISVKLKDETVTLVEKKYLEDDFMVFIVGEVSEIYTVTDEFQATCPECTSQLNFEIHFGNTYPIHAQESGRSETVYNTEKEVFLKIISTLEFK